MLSRQKTRASNYEPIISRQLLRDNYYERKDNAEQKLRPEVDMSNFLSKLENEKKRLEKCREAIKKSHISSKKHLFVSKEGKHSTYYYELTTKNGDKKRKYLGKSDSEQLKLLINESYKNELNKIIDHDIDLITKMIKDYISTDTDSVMKRLSPCVHMMRPDVYFDDEMKSLNEWASSQYAKNSLPFGERIIKAKDGTRVRSKTECIIYNALLNAMIPFRYDPVLEFQVRRPDGIISKVYKSPDFQIKCPDGSFILIEHGGLLNSDLYSNELFEKIRIYLQNGFVLGHNLYVTSDDFDGGINSKSIQQLVDAISERFEYL